MKAITYHEWKNFFAVLLPNETREKIVPCGALSALDDLLSLCAALSHGTDNNPPMPESITSSLFLLCEHFFSEHNSSISEDVTHFTEAESNAALTILRALRDRLIVETVQFN